MIWIAPSEEDTASAALEKRLWDAADQFRPKKCEVRFATSEVQSLRHSAFGIRHWPRLPAEARFDYLLNRPEAENIGAKVNAAMRDGVKCEVRVATSEVQSLRHSKFGIRHSPVPASLDHDALGLIYEYFLGEVAMSECQGGGEPSGASSTTGTVARRVSASDSANQFYTPRGMVRLLTEVIEPYPGRVLDPACGSGPAIAGFVSSARFASENLALAA